MAVNRGIAIDFKKGAANAWAYMKYVNVPQRVILRVLAEPSLRRPMALAVPLENNTDDSHRDVYRNVIHLWRAPSA
ncbi:hypothetical protein GTP55_08210 [Duganella sp. FT109W]|uniref:Uncharacterized protein n=1 Tax=Duganella margarita TaxID=2692170 RepID=A0ABW9WEI9_9BURK|nr:hypothetical protein [Duganella margarita]MYN39353.1 hypothetical protein [Duganella margarita]